MLGSDFVSQESNKILKKSDSRDSGTEEGFEILEREEKERRRSEDSVMKVKRNLALIILILNLVQ